MMNEPQQEHQWLQRLVGAWTFESDCSMGPGKPRETFTGTETVRSLGGLWILAEGEGAMPGGGTAHTMMTVGYDVVKGRYVGTWTGSMMAYLWVYDGTMDASGRVLVLEAEGPDFSKEGVMTRYRDEITIESDDLRRLTSRTLGEDGEWHEFVTVTYRRRA